MLFDSESPIAVVYRISHVGCISCVQTNCSSMSYKVVFINRPLVLQFWNEGRRYSMFLHYAMLIIKRHSLSLSIYRCTEKACLDYKGPDKIPYHTKLVWSMYMDFLFGMARHPHMNMTQEYSRPTNIKSHRSDLLCFSFSTLLPSKPGFVVVPFRKIWKESSQRNT